MPATFLADRPRPVPIGRGSAPPFPVVRRGYDPAAVDAHVAGLQEALRELRGALDESDRRRDLAERHAVGVEDEIRSVRAAGRPAEPEAGFGVRAERLLRLAESEAAQVREQAVAAAAEVLGRARRDADRVRHETERRLAAETARTQQELAARTAFVERRDRESRERAEIVGAASARTRRDAERDAAALRAAAESDAGGTRDAADRDAARTRAAASADLERLRTAQRTAHEDLTRLVAAVRGAVG